MWQSGTSGCSPSYLGGLEWEDCGVRIAQANSLQDPISKITRAKWTGGMPQAVEHLLCKCEALSSNPNPTHRKILYLYTMEYYKS
jgi:hypothetical protein